MPSATSDVDEIRRQMAQIRVNLHQDMRGVVAGAEAASDWRHYVRIYPWAALATALAAGFLIVPRRRRSVRATAEAAATAAVAKAQDAAAGSEPKDQVQTEKRRSGVLGLAFGFLGPVALRAAQSYAASYLENVIAQQHQGGPQSMARPATF